MPIPMISRENPRPRLIVDGQPFIILGAQWDYRRVQDHIYRDGLFPLASKLNCNTAFIPIFWSQVEPELNLYDFGVVEEILVSARRQGLRLVLLWFGSNREGSFGFRPRTDDVTDCGMPAFISQVPRYIVDDPATYPRAIGDDGSRHSTALCPMGGATLARETKAFQAFMAYLAANDNTRTTIMVQINNEICTPPVGYLRFADGCRCSACEEERHGHPGLHTAAAVCYARYVGTMAAAGAAVYPLPFYVNFVGDSRPGEDIQTYLDLAPQLACVGSDAYGRDADDFRAIMRRFRVGRNVPFVPETASDEHTATENNLLIGLEEFGIIGMDLWAIDYPVGYWTWQPEPRDSAPLFAEDGTPSSRAEIVAEVFGLVDRARTVIGERLGTGDLFAFTGEGNPAEFTRNWPEGTVIVKHEGGGRGMVVRQAPGEYTILGRSCSVILPEAVDRAARGSWQGDCWQTEGLIGLSQAGAGSVLRLEKSEVIRVPGNIFGI